jgi:hypothetical protein
MGGIAVVWLKHFTMLTYITVCGMVARGPYGSTLPFITVSGMIEAPYGANLHHQPWYGSHITPAYC